MSDNHNKPSEQVSLLAGTLSLILQLPIQFILLHGLLTRTDAPTFHWILFVLWLPLAIVIRVAWNVARLLVVRGE